MNSRLGPGTPGLPSPGAGGGKPMAQLQQQLLHHQQSPGASSSVAGSMMMPPPPPMPVVPGSGPVPGHGLQQQQMMGPQSHYHPPPQQPNPPNPVGTINASPTILCRFGTEIVHEIVSKTLELFGILRSMTPHSLAAAAAATGSAAADGASEKKAKVKELTKYLDLCFKRLRLIYEKVNNQFSSGMLLEYTGPDGPSLTSDFFESLIPYKEDEDDSDEDESLKASDHQVKSPSEEDMDQEQDQKSKSTGPDQEYLPFTGLRRLTPERKAADPKLASLEAEYEDLLGLNQLKSRQMKEIIDRLRKLVWDINTMLAMRQLETPKGGPTLH